MPYWAGLVAGACALLSVPMGQLIRLGIQELVELVPYIGILGRALLGFAADYAFIALVFASWYWGGPGPMIRPEGAFSNLPKLVQDDPKSSFADLPPAAQFGNLTNLSAVTISTLGYGEITPKSGLTKALATGEVILGVGWITVVFALILTRYQDEVAAIARERRGTA